MGMQKLRELLVECWDHDPNKRPPFDDITDRLETLLDAMGVRKQPNKNLGAASAGGCCAQQ